MIELNPEVILNKLEYKVNELSLRNQELDMVGRRKHSLESTYRCELRKELLKLTASNTKISIIGDMARGKEQIAKLRLDRDLATNEYFTIKSAIENIKIEIEVLRSMLTWLRVELKNS